MAFACQTGSLSPSKAVTIPATETASNILVASSNRCASHAPSAMPANENP